MPAEKLQLRDKIRDQSRRAREWGRLEEDTSPVREVSEIGRASDDPRVVDITGFLVVGWF
jgi:hypothetical protein